MTLEAQLKNAVSRSGTRYEAKAIQLLKQGANPNAENGALFRWAILLERESLVRAFLRHGAKITPEALQNALNGERKTRRMSEILLNHGANPNAVVSYQAMDDSGKIESPPILYTPLMVAAEAGNIDAAKLLIERGANLHTKLPNGWTALKVAAYAGNLTLCRFFLDRKADFRGAQEPLLRIAISKNNLAFFDFLKQRGALPNPMQWPLDYYNLSLPMAQKMIAAGASPNGDASAISGSPLRIAVLKKDWPLTQFLLDKGARIGADVLQATIGDYFTSPAQQKLQAEAFKRYANGHPDPFNEELEDESTHNAPEDLRGLQLLLERGANTNLASGREGDTALHAAASRNRKGAVALLLKAGANLEAKNRRGQTPLQTAISSFGDEVIPVLLDAGADLEARDDEGNTPLLTAASYGANVTYYPPLSSTAVLGDASSLIQLLLQRGADVKAANSQGMTALHLAAGVGHAAPMRLLLKSGAVLEAASKSGLTPLGAACLNGRVEAARVLLERGANPDLPDAHGQTPRQITLQPFLPKMEVAGGRKLSPYEEKQNQEFLRSYAAPIQAGRRKISELFRKIR